MATAPAMTAFARWRELLRAICIARRPRRSLRREEFAIVLSETSADNAELVAETLRLAVADLALPHAGSSHGCATISLGIAGAKCDARTSAPSILTAADGPSMRNRACTAAESPSLTLVWPAG